MSKRLLALTLVFFSSLLVAQDIRWQQTLGGNREEHLYDAISTYDYGLLLAGSSVSEASGNKTNGSVADLDYWLWKMTEDGTLEWQKNYGGSGNDYLYSVSYTQDGGYILGGSSDSPKGHDKDAEGAGGLDYWLIKLSPLGDIEWQKTYGGSEDERLTAIAQREDGGFWVAGTSSSTAMGNEDVWVLRLDAKGELLWEKTLGGLRKDNCRGMALTEKGLLITAFSNSQKIHGQAYVAHIAHTGQLLWDYSFGDTQVVPAGITQTAAGHFVVAGSCALEMEDETQTPETDYWVLAFDIEGRILHKEHLDLGEQDKATRMIALDDGQLVLSGFSAGEKTLNEDYTVVSFSPKAGVLWHKQWKANADDRLQQVVATQDKGLLLAGTSNSMAAYDKTVATTGHSDYWILKTGAVKRFNGEDGFADEETMLQEEKRQITAFPIPAKRYVTVVVPFDFTAATLTVHDLGGRLIHQQPMDSRTEILDMKHWPQGIFLLQVVADEHTMERKLVKDE